MLTKTPSLILPKPPPAAIIDAQGRPIFGVFADGIARINVEDFDYRTPMGGKANFLKRWLGFKQFEYFGILSNELLFGCALVNLRYLSSAFCYVYLPRTQELLEFTYRNPLAYKTHNASSPLQGRSSFQSGPCQIEMEYTEIPRQKRLHLQIRDQLEADIHFDETAAGFEPMSLCTQVGRNGWVYAHKVAAVPAFGCVRGNFGEFNLQNIDAYAHHDFSAGYMRRETFWNWACLSGRLADSRTIGLNISCGVNETSFSENCFWLDGKLHPAGLAQFHYSADAPLSPWQIIAGEGSVDLHFVPEGRHVERLDAGIVRSHFQQIFGRFSGVIRTIDGENIPIRDQYGFVEDQYALW